LFWERFGYFSHQKKNLPTGGTPDLGLATRGYLIDESYGIGEHLKWSFPFISILQI
jgi:hypothetical protein